MFKDVLVNLSVADRRDPACDYAVSVANAFECPPQWNCLRLRSSRSRHRRRMRGYAARMD